MSSMSDLFGLPGGETNDTPFDPARLNADLDRILAERPPAGAPEGYVRPGHAGPPAAAPDGGPPAVDQGVGSAPAAAPESPALPPPGAWPPGPASPWMGAPPTAPPAVAPPAAPPAPPAAPPAVAPPADPLAPPADPFAGTPFAGATPLELQELALIRQSLADPERSGAIRQAYIGGVPAPPAAPPAAATPPPAAPAGFVPKPMPEEIEAGTPEAEMWDMAQEHERQLAEIRGGIQQRNEEDAATQRRAAAVAATTEFKAKYGHALSDSDIQWVAQSAGYQNLPDAFENADRSAGRPVDIKRAMDQALEFQLRSTDVLLTKILTGAPAAAAPPAGVPAPPPQPPGYAPPVVQPGQTPEADARKRYLTAVSSPASPSGEAPTRTPISHRPDGKIEEKSRMQLIQEMTGGGALQELLGP